LPRPSWLSCTYLFFFLYIELAKVDPSISALCDIHVSQEILGGYQWWTANRVVRMFRL
jgi:hypothetical protein